jgi:hypothetical protein
MANPIHADILSCFESRDDDDDHFLHFGHLHIGSELD